VPDSHRTSLDGLPPRRPGALATVPEPGRIIRYRLAGDRIAALLASG